MLQEQRATEALALLDAAPAPPVGQKRHWLLQRALALVQLNRLADMRQVLDEFAACGPVPPALAPLWHWRKVLLAQAEGNAGEAARQAGLMQAALETMGPDAVPEHRLMAHYDLARFWAERNDRAAAFAQWQAGHALLRRTQKFFAGGACGLYRRSHRRSARHAFCRRRAGAKRRSPRQSSSSACPGPAPRCVSRYWRHMARCMGRANVRPCPA